MTEILDQAVEQYRRRVFLEELNADFKALRKNRRAWKQELAERVAWDAASDDRVED